MNEKRYYIKDENNYYVDSMSIYKVDGKYFYKSFPTFSNGCRRYTTLDAATKALDKLELYNQRANMNHQFSLDCI